MISAHQLLSSRRRRRRQFLLELALPRFVMKAAVRDIHCSKNVVHRCLSISSANHRTSAENVHYEGADRFAVFHARRAPLGNIAVVFTNDEKLDGKAAFSLLCVKSHGAATETAL